MILKMLAAGSVHLTAVRLLAPHPTLTNHSEVLEAARGKRKVEIEEIVAGLSPRPDVPSSVRRLPKAPLGPAQPVAALDVCAAGITGSGAEELGSGTEKPAASMDPPVVRTAARPDRETPVVAPSLPPLMPLSPDRYKLQVTISGQTLEKLRLAKDMLGHALPSGDDEPLLDRALTALLTELARKKFADTARPRPSGGAPRGGNNPSAVVKRRRSPSAAVKRVVWVRDLGRCAFIGKNGHRCSERRFVEFHHVDPYALGGEATVDGIQLRCRRHNDYEGRLYFGERRSQRELVPERVRLSAAGSS